MEPGNSEFTSEFFDNASNAWVENKIRHRGSYVYKCAYIHSNNKQCSKASTINEFSKRHTILLKSQNKQFK